MSRADPQRKRLAHRHRSCRLLRPQSSAATQGHRLCLQADLVHPFLPDLQALLLFIIVLTAMPAIQLTGSATGRTSGRLAIDVALHRLRHTTGIAAAATIGATESRRLRVEESIGEGTMAGVEILVVMRTTTTGATDGREAIDAAIETSGAQTGIVIGSRRERAAGGPVETTETGQDQGLGLAHDLQRGGQTTTGGSGATRGETMNTMSVVGAGHLLPTSCSAMS